MTTARIQPVVAGIVAALVGFASSFAVVLAGLRAVGADQGQAASGLLALCLAQGVGTLVLSWRFRLPLTLAWSTPGAAMLAGTAVGDGWAAAVGAFLATGALLVATAAWPVLGDLVARIPRPVAHAMLAGVLLPLCIAPVTASIESPAIVVPVVLTWLVLVRLAPRAAVPAAFAVALVGIGVWLVAGEQTVDGPLLPHLAWTTPELSVGALIGIALPLYVVTMAAQNVPGVAVMASFGYRVPWRPSMLVTGVGTFAAAPWGGHAVNLAAITAALTAGPSAGEDRHRRWWASQATGWTYVVVAGLSTALAALVVAAPAGVIEAVAGLALLATLASSLQSAMADPDGRTPAVVTFVVAAAGVSLAGVGSAFWALVAGVVVHLVLRPTRRIPDEDAGDDTDDATGDTNGDHTAVPPDER